MYDASLRWRVLQRRRQQREARYQESLQAAGDQDREALQGALESLQAATTLEVGSILIHLQCPRRLLLLTLHVRGGGYLLWTTWSAYGHMHRHCNEALCLQELSFGERTTCILVILRKCIDIRNPADYSGRSGPQAATP